MPNLINQYLEDLFNPNTGVAFEGRLDDVEVVIDTFKDDVADNTFVKKVNDTTMTGVPASNDYSSSNSDLVIRESGIIKSNKLKVGTDDKTFANGVNLSMYDDTNNPQLNLVGGYVSSTDIKEPSINFVKEDSSGNVDFDTNEGSFRLKLKKAGEFAEGLWFEENFGSSGIYSYVEFDDLVVHWNKADYNNTNRFNLTRLNHQHHVYDPTGNNNYYISTRPRTDCTQPYFQTFPNLSGEYILDQTPEYLGLNSLRNSLNGLTNNEIVLKTGTDTFSSIVNNSNEWNTNTSWRADFNSQNTGELLTRDGTNSFGTEVFGNNYTNIEIKKSSLGGILNSHIFSIDRQGSYTFTDFNQSGGQYNNSVIESSINSGTTMTIELPTASGQLATLNDIPTHYWSANGNDIYKTNSGNVGIGTQTPQELLEVSGTVPRIRIYDGSSSRNPGLEFVRGSSTFGSDGFHDWRIHDESGNLKFYGESTATGVVNGNSLWLGFNGKNGLRVDNPVSIFEIKGTDHNSHFSYSTSENTYIRGGKNASSVFIADTGLKRVRIGDSSAGAEGTLDIVGNGSNSHFNYGTNNSTYIRAGTTSADVFIADNTASGQVGIFTNTPNVGFDCEIAGSTLVSDNFQVVGSGVFSESNYFTIQTDPSNGVKLNFQSSGQTTDFMKMGAYANVNNIQNYNRDLVIYGGSTATDEVARFKSSYMELQNAVHSKLNFVNTTTAGSYNYMAFYDGSVRYYFMGQDGGNNGDFMIGGNFGRSLLIDRNTGKFKIQKNTEILANLSFDAGVNAQTYITIGGNSLASNLYGINLVSTASERKHVAIGQDSTHSGFISWEYNSNVNDALFSFSTYGGANPLYLQRDGGNVGIGHFQDGVNSGKATRTLDVNGTFLARSTSTFQGLINMENTLTIFNASPNVILRDTTDRDDVQIRFDGLYSGVNQTNARITTANDYLNLETTTTQGFNGIRFNTNNLIAGTIDNNQFWYINNRLGLGGITPQVTLDVSGSIKFNDGTFNNYNPQINHNDTTFKIDYYDLANPGLYPERFWKIQQQGADSTYHDLFSYNNTTKEFLTIGNLQDNLTNPANSWANSRNWKTYDNTNVSFFGDLTKPYGFTIESIVQANRADIVSKQDQETLTFAMKGHHINEPILSYPDRLVSGQVAERISLDGTSSAKSFLNPEYTTQTLDSNVIDRSSLIFSGKELNGRYNAEQIKNNVFTPKQISDSFPVRNTENMGQMTFIGTNNFLDGSNLYGRIVIQKDFIAPEDYNNSHNTTEPNTATQKQVYTWTGYFSTRTSYITPMLFKRKFSESRDGYSEDTWNCLLIGIGTTRQGSGSVGWQTFEFGLQLGTDVITEDCCLGFFCGSMIWDNLTKRFSVRTYDNNPLYYQFLDNLPNSSMWTPDSWTGLYSGSTSGIVGQPVFSTTERRIRQNGEGSLNTYFFTDNFFNKVGWKADYVPLSTDAFGTLTQRQYFFYFTAIQKEYTYQHPSNKVISESLSKGKYENIGFNSPLLDAPNNSNYQLTQLKAPQFVNGSSKKYQAVVANTQIGDENFIISFWLNLSTNADTNTIVGQQTQIVLGSGGRNLNTGFQINIVAISGSSYSMQLFTANGSSVTGTIPIRIPSPVGGVWRHYEFVIKRQSTNPYGGFSVPSQVGFNNFNSQGLSKAYINGVLVGHGAVLDNHFFNNTEFGIGGDSGTGTYNNLLSGYVTKVFYGVGISDSTIDLYTQQNSFNAGFAPEAGVTGPRYWYNKVLNDAYFRLFTFKFLWDFRGTSTGAVAGAFPRGSIANYTSYASLQAWNSPTIFYVNGLHIYEGVDGEYQIVRRTDDGNETELFKEFAYTNYNDKAVRVSKDYVDINNGSVAEIKHDNNNQPIGNYVNFNNPTFTPIQEYLRQPMAMEAIWVNETHPQVPCTTQRLVMFRKDYYVKGYSQQPLNARWLGRGKVLFEIRSNIYVISTPVINIRLMGWMLGPDCKYSGGTNFWSWVELANIPNQDRRLAFNGSNFRAHYNRWYYCDLDVIGRNYIQYVKLEITTIGGSWSVDQYDGFSCVMYSLPSITNLSGGIPSN